MGYFTSIYAEDLPHRAKAVYMYLRDRADKDGRCYLAIGHHCQRAEALTSTVKPAIADLEKNGHLFKEQRWRENGGKSSLLYTLKL